MTLNVPITTFPTRHSLCVQSACLVTTLRPSLRLSVGHHQTHHLSWWAQVRSAGWGQHRQHPEGSVGGTGVPSQKRTDSSVGHLSELHRCNASKGIFKQRLNTLTIVSWRDQERRDQTRNFPLPNSHSTSWAMHPLPHCLVFPSPLDLLWSSVCIIFSCLISLLCVYESAVWTRPLIINMLKIHY